MQQELNQSHPDLKIQILGVNELGHESGNPTATGGRTIPWLQDVDSNGDQRSDNFMNAWDYEYRDVVIVDAQNNPIDVYNLTLHNLADQGNYDTMRQKLLDAAQANVSFSWTNPTEPLDVNNDTFISPLDVLLILNDLNSAGARELGPPPAGSEPPPYIDPTGDGFVSPLDALTVINHLNAVNSVQSVAAVPASADFAQGSTAIEAASRPAVTNSSLLAAAVDEIFVDEHDDGLAKRRELADSALALT